MVASARIAARSPLITASVLAHNAQHTKPGPRSPMTVGAGLLLCRIGAALPHYQLVSMRVISIEMRRRSACGALAWPLQQLRTRERIISSLSRRC